MFCSHCGREVEEGSAFCPACGKPLAKDPPGGWNLYAHDLTRLSVPGEEKSPVAAALLGFFLGYILLGPAGYIYLGQWNWFWLTFVIQIFAIPFTAGLAYILLPVVFAVHQYQMAMQLNEMRDSAQRAERDDGEMRDSAQRAERNDGDGAGGHRAEDD